VEPKRIRGVLNQKRILMEGKYSHLGEEEEPRKIHEATSSNDWGHRMGEKGGGKLKWKFPPRKKRNRRTGKS